MTLKGKKFKRIKRPGKGFKTAVEMARRPMPKPVTDMGDKSKYKRRWKYKPDWKEDNEG